MGRPPFVPRGLSIGQSGANNSTPNGKEALKDADAGVDFALSQMPCKYSLRRPLSDLRYWRTPEET